MKRFLMLTAMAVGLGVGAAHAQKVADLGMAGMDPASGKAPKQAAAPAVAAPARHPRLPSL